MIIAAGKFKASCLKLMDRVQQTHEEIIISKRGKPVAKLVPVEPEASRPIFGYMQHTVTEHGDITEPSGEFWDADQ